MRGKREVLDKHRQDIGIEQIVIFLNQQGLTPLDGEPGSNRNQGESDGNSYFRYESTAQRSGTNGRSLGSPKTFFQFDNRNPKQMMEVVLDRHKLAFCLSDSRFELKQSWFREHFHITLEKDGELPKGALENLSHHTLVATLEFLGYLAKQTPSIVSGLRRSRFALASYELDFAAEAVAPNKEENSAQGGGGHHERIDLLHRWWLFTQHVCRALKSYAIDHDNPSSPSSSSELHETRGGILKLRAHLAACLIESRSAEDWRNDRLRHGNIPDYHDSMVEWLEYNLSSREGGEDLVSLESRYRELGDLLFQDSEKRSLRTWVSSSRFREARGSETLVSWRSCAYLRVRNAFRIPWTALSSRPSNLKRILNQQWGIFQDTERFFYQHREIPEFMALSRASADVSRELSPFHRLKSQGRTDRHGPGGTIRRSIVIVSEKIRSYLRNLPVPYRVFLSIATISWLSMALERPAQSLGSTSSVVQKFTNSLFSAQYALIFGGMIIFALLIPFRFRRIHSIFEQAMPDILGSILLGYLYLSFAEEMWQVPLTMNWALVVGLTAALVSVACLSLVVEVAARTRRRDDTLRKATSMSLIALSQSYAIGLLLTTFLGPSFVSRGEMAVSPLPIQSGSLVVAPEGDIQPVAVPKRRFWRSESRARLVGKPAGGVAGEEDQQWEQCRTKLEGQGKMRTLFLGPLELWLFPKLLLFWSGLALFIGIFVQSLTARLNRSDT